MKTLRFIISHPVQRYRFALPASVLAGALFLSTVTTAAADSTSRRGFHREPLVAQTTDGQELLLYKESHALLIGVSQYEHWSTLRSIPHELDSVETALHNQGFNVERLADPSARDLRSGISDFIDQYGFDSENRLLIYFSGHGHSYAQETKGYIVPTDAPLPDNRRDFRRHAVSMDRIMAWARDIQAKHVLFVFDSCFSGSVFKSKSSPTKKERYIRRVTERPVRQFLTAGSAGEEVPAKSTFTPAFVDAIQGEADINDDGYVTGNELGLHLTQYVSRYTRQTPQFGPIPDYALGRGDFVFFTNTPDEEVADETEAATTGPDDADAQLANLPSSLLAIETILWESAQQDNTETSYSSYLSKFPNGYFSAIAADRLKRLREARERQRERLEREKQNLATLERVAAETAEQERQARELAEREAQIAAESQRREDQKAELAAQKRQRAQESARQEAERIAALAKLARVERTDAARNQKLTTERHTAQNNSELVSVTTPTDAVMNSGNTSARAAEREPGITRPLRRGIQVALNRAGINVGIEDGVWGKKTRAGIAQWQRQNNLKESGYLDRTQLNLLVADLKAKPVASFQPKPAQQTRKRYEPQMVFIKGGQFQMGSNTGGEPDEKPSRRVTVKDFEMSQFEITFDQYDHYAKSTRVKLPDDEGWGRGKRPVINVSWNDALAYVRWLNRRTKHQYRLPTEAEWEYAARAGSNRRWSGEITAGNLAKHANVKGRFDNFQYTGKVGSLLPNAFGLHDMHGNVLEWVYDCWHDSYVKAPTAADIPWDYQCSGAVRRVLRGGSWNSEPDQSRSAYRIAYKANSRLNNVGLRLVRSK